jgi:dTMP kinase
MSKPVVIAVEGLEGASKSTSIQTIADVFTARSIPLTFTREPGGTPMAESIRDIHKAQWPDEEVTPDTELLLMFAARSQLIHNVVIPWGEKGNVILFDRMWWSTFAYQVFGVLDTSLYNMLEQRVTKHVNLTAVLHLDIPPDVGLLRARGRGELDRIEQKGLDFFERARRGYHHLAAMHHDICTTVDANRDLALVQADVRAWAEATADKITHNKD